MTKKAEREANALVELWATRLGLLPNWHLDIEFTPLSGTTVAQIAWAEGYQSARIQISEDRWAAASPAMRNRVIIHELRHLVYAPLVDRLATYCGYQSIVWTAVQAELEKICDSDAGVFRRMTRRARA